MSDRSLTRGANDHSRTGCTRDLSGGCLRAGSIRLSLAMRTLRIDREA
jgi:hypothetical protein